MLVAAFRAGDRDAQSELVCAHLRLVHAVARRVTPAPDDDTLAEGALGLVEALHRFDHARGARLSTYAAFWIRARVQRFVLANRRIVPSPDTRGARRVFAQVGRAQRKLAAFASEPRADELAREIGVPVADVEAVLVAIRRSDISVGSSGEPGEVELAFDGDGPEALLLAAERARTRRTDLQAALARLPARERRIIEQRTLADRAMTLSALGRELALSRERVRQLEAHARMSLREALLEHRP